MWFSEPHLLHIFITLIVGKKFASFATLFAVHVGTLAYGFIVYKKGIPAFALQIINKFNWYPRNLKNFNVILFYYFVAYNYDIELCSTRYF